MCSIITINNGAVKPAKLEKYLLRESSMNDDGMALILQDSAGRLTSLKTFELNTVLNLLDSTDWVRMWMHMRAATQGDVNIRNTHGWMTTDGTAVMHNGVLFDQDTYKFNVDSELIVDWLEKCGIELTLELLLTENYANVFLIENYGDYYVSRTKGGSLFTDGQGNFSTNQVGRINKAVKSGYQMSFKSGFVKPKPEIREILDYHDEDYLSRYYGKVSDGYYSSYDVKTGVTSYKPYRTGVAYLPAAGFNERFNDEGKQDGQKPNAEKPDAGVLLEEINEASKLNWDSVQRDKPVHEDYFTDSEYQDLLDAGELAEYERKRKAS